MGRSLPAKTRSKPHGRWSIGSLRTIIEFAATNAARGDRKRLTHSSLQTAVGTTQAPMAHPNSHLFSANFCSCPSYQVVPAAWRPDLLLRVPTPIRVEIVLFILSDEHYGSAISPAIQKNRSEAGSPFPSF